MFAAAGLGEDAILLDALVKAFQGAFEGFVITYDDFGHVRESPAFSRDKLVAGAHAEPPS